MVIQSRILNLLSDPSRYRDRPGRRLVAARHGSSILSNHSDARSTSRLQHKLKPESSFEAGDARGDAATNRTAVYPQLGSRGRKDRAEPPLASWY